MNRRDFLTSTLAVGTLSANPLPAKSEKRTTEERDYFELVKYQLHVGRKKNLVANFYQDVAIPALNRLGIGPIGVFNVKFGSNAPTLFVLIPHKSIESVVTINTRLLEDEEFLKLGTDFLDVPLSEPAYIRIESSLMIAFSHMPKLEVPTSLMEHKSRIYEMRIYESHNRKYAKKKIEMFNQGGEIDIFRKTGLQPIFFGETLIGSQMPNLTYMLVFENIAARDKNWDTFKKHPDWLTLKVNPAYADTVSNITDIILQPMSFSQI